MILLLAPRANVFASAADIEIEILKIRIMVLELRVQQLLIMIDEIRLKEATAGSSLEIKPEDNPKDETIKEETVQVSEEYKPPFNCSKCAQP